MNSHCLESVVRLMRGDSDADVRVLGVFFQADDVVGLVLRY